MTNTKLAQVTELNDQFRKQELSFERLSMSQKVEALPENKKQALLHAVSSVDYFIETPVMDSSKLHDFGLVTLDDRDYFWEIDYYNKSLQSKSPNPADPNCTTRILTVLRTDEY